METALLFPAQGSQKPGMLHALVDDPAVHETLDEISDVLGSDVRLLDSPEALQSTVAVQIALVRAGVALPEHCKGMVSIVLRSREC